jgi:hypothetical protein
MDPYLEGPDWLDFHSRFVNAWCEAVADGLPDEYEASIGEQIDLIELDPDIRKRLNVSILEGPRVAYIEILQRPERAQVAVLKLLSPANKQNPGRTEYLSKRASVLYRDVHLVELDLLLGGQRIPTLTPLPSTDYYYFVARAEQRPDCHLYAWNLRDAMPRVPVPLRSPQAEVIVDLAQVFTTAYDRGRFGRRLRYDRPCLAPLSDEQRRWVTGIVAANR